MLNTEVPMKIYKYGKFQLNEFERTLAETFTRTHRCPWYKRLFDNTRPEFSYSQGTDGIGTYTTVKCEKCGKEFDVTDYEFW